MAHLGSSQKGIELSAQAQLPGCRWEARQDRPHQLLLHFVAVQLPPVQQAHQKRPLLGHCFPQQAVKLPAATQAQVLHFLWSAQFPAGFPHAHKAHYIASTLKSANDNNVQLATFE